MMLVGIALTLSTWVRGSGGRCRGRQREAAVVGGDSRRVCACVQMVAQAKASSSAMDDRILRLLAELGRRGIEAVANVSVAAAIDRRGA